MEIWKFKREKDTMALHDHAARVFSYLCCGVDQQRICELVNEVSEAKGGGVVLRFVFGQTLDSWDVWTN